MKIKTDKSEKIVKVTDNVFFPEVELDPYEKFTEETFIELTNNKGDEEDE